MRDIWVIRLSALGDLVLCEPAVAGIAAAHPQARLCIVTRRRYFDVFRAHPQVHAQLTLDEARASAPPDLAVDLHNRLDTARLARRAGAVVRWRKRGVLDLARAALGRPLHRGYRSGPHQTERIARALAPHGLQPCVRPPRLHLDPGWRAHLDPGRHAVLLPAATHAVKAWPVAGFAQVARALGAAGFTVSVLVGPGEADVAAAVVALAPGARALPADLSVGEAAATLARAALVIGNDSGLLHVAAAVGAPVVGLFGPTPPGRWGPPLARGAIVSSDPPCGPCSDFGGRPCHRQRRTCLDDLSADVVVSAAHQLASRCLSVRPAE